MKKKARTLSLPLRIFLTLAISLVIINGVSQFDLDIQAKWILAGTLAVGVTSFFFYNRFAIIFGAH